MFVDFIGETNQVARRKLKFSEHRFLTQQSYKGSNLRQDIQ